MISVGPKANTPIDAMKLWHTDFAVNGFIIREHKRFGKSFLKNLVPIGFKLEIPLRQRLLKPQNTPQNVPERRTRLKANPQLYKYSSFCHSIVIRFTHNHLEQCHSRRSRNRNPPGFIERSLAVFSVSMGPFWVPEKWAPKSSQFSAR
jgi:hypothetical protein